MFHALLKNYQKKLINLSGSNRALLLLRLSKENDLDLHDLDFLLNKPSFSIVENLIAGKNKFPLCQLLDSRNEKVNLVGRQLQCIARKDQFLFEESGSQDLYIGWPFARGQFSDGTLVHCPLLFFPVSLRLEENTWQLVQRDNEPVSLNKSFLLAWQHYNQASLTDDLLETSFETFSKEPREFRTQLYELFKANGLELHFNTDLFVDKLEAFQTFKSAELAEATEVGRLKLFNEAVLGIFPQAGSYLVPDYDTLLEQGDLGSLEDFFSSKLVVGSSKLEDGDSLLTTHNSSPIKESDLHTPLPLDAPQEEAIKIVKRGQSLVVQGPPGTGKSQLISNLVADFISQGKKTLVVCQKRAALDVVYKRLASIGAGDFIALVHDFKADRNEVYSKMAKQIDHIDEYKKANTSLDTVFLERNYTDACRKIDQCAEQLESLRAALFDASECGISVKELYLTSDSSLPILPQADSFYKYFTYDKLLDFNAKLKWLLPYALEFDHPQHAWQQRISFKAHTYQDKTILANALSELHKFVEAIDPALKSLDTHVVHIWELRSHTPLLAELRLRSESTVFYQHFQVFAQSNDTESKLAKWNKRLEKWKERTLQMVGKPLAKGVTPDTLADLLTKTEKAEDALGGFLSKIAWQWFAKEKPEVLAALKANRLPETLDGVKELNIRLKNSEAFYLLKEEYKQNKEFEFGDEQSAEEYADTIEEIQKALESTEQWWITHQQIRYPITLNNLSRTAFLSTAEQVEKLIEKVASAYQSHLVRFTEEHLHELLGSGTLYHALQELDSRFDALVEYDKAKAALTFQEEQALNLLVVSYGLRVASDVESNSKIHNHSSKPENTESQSLPTTHNSQPETKPATYNSQLATQFDNSIRRLWIQHIENKYPLLRGVSSHAVPLLEQELNEAIAQKEDLSREILMIKLREQAYRNEEFNRLGNRTTYRDLHHQATKKKKIWPLRKTLEAFHQEALYVLPCWLASPETVSAIFPLQELFDLVIFDEASQCYAEKGIPAMSRGKQVVVAGDSKQLPPSDLYRTRFNEDDENVPESEIDSLLDLASRYLPQVMLTEHYRSRSLDLIDFSNQHFYKHKLALLPDFQTFQGGHKGIQYIKTEGFLEAHCNRAEAEKVADLCLALFKAQPEKEVGVITFNIHQQYLIQDLLDERCAAEKRTLPETFIVKNIENIQGDEKDIILFSIGYAPDKAGRMQHHFGSLNQAGGENRLNVAVTRARDKVIVVTSIYPTLLNVESTLHEGPKLLKKYLEYALNVSEGRFVPVLRVEHNFRPEWYLKEKLKKQKTKNWSDELPFADLTEKDEMGRFKQILLTDDDKLYNSLSVKETFSYLPRTLRAKNWKFERAWSRNN